MPQVRWKPLRPVPLLPAALLGIVVLGALVVALAVQLRPATWTATSELVYETGATDAVLGTTSATVDIDRILATEVRIILGDAVIGAVADELGTSRIDLAEATTVEAIQDSNVLTISVDANTASDAQLRTQIITERYVMQAREAVRQSLLEQVSVLRGPIGSLQEQAASAPPGPRATAIQTTLADLQQQRLRLRSAANAEPGPVALLSAAAEPENPSSLGAVTGMILGAGVGLVLAIGAYFVLDWVRRSKTRD